MQFRYYKGHEKRERWRAIEVSKEETRLAMDDVAFATILTVSEKVKPGEAVSDSASYVGPFYVDIDNDKDLQSSIKTAQKVVKKFLDNGIPPEAVSIWASGKKGFHITIPMELFCDGKPVEKLPLVYRQMAIALKLFEIKDVDATVYSTGKGRMWRLENKERADNGKFKVPITVSELMELSVEACEELVKQPRTIKRYSATGKVSMLEALFKMSKGRAEQMEKPKGIFIDPNLKEALDHNLPPCVEDLKNNVNVRDGKGFNDISMQFAKGVASFCPDDAKELISTFADNTTGSTYNTPSKRKTHCTTAFKIAAKNSGYEWSCASILSVLKKEPCDKCPIAFIRVQQEDGDVKPAAPPVKPKKPKAEVQYDVSDIPLEGLIIEEDEAEADAGEPAEAESIESEPEGPSPAGSESVGNQKSEEAEDNGFNLEGLMKTDDGYCFMDSTGKARRISNFVLNIQKIFVEYVPNLECDRRVGVQADVIIGNRKVGSTFLEEANWQSKSSFISSLAGLANAAFYGKDDDVQKMKSALMENLESGTTTVRRVYSVGIHRQQVGDQWVFTYVEPGWSIDQYGNENFYLLSGKVNASPRLKNVKPMVEGDPRVSEALTALIGTNLPHNVAQILGWTMASFLKQHIFAFNNEFPLLSIHGPPGSGKSTTATIFAALHGVDYALEASPVNLPTSTPFVVWSTIASSMTVPRIYEEFNKSKLPRTYDLYTENFKACWNQYSVQRGSIKNEKMHGTTQIGAHSTDIPLTGAVMLCSEQNINVPSLVERTIQVGLTPTDRARDDYEQACLFVKARLEWLKPFAKAAYMEALEISVDEVQEWLAEVSDMVPYEISSRPRLSYRLTLVGLRFLERLIKKYKLDGYTKFGNLRDEYLDWLNANRREIANSKKVSEVDQIISKLAIMAAMSESKGQLPWFVKREHYLRNGDSLYLDPLIAHAMYVRYMNQVEKHVPVIENVKEFMGLMKAEKYVLSMSEVIPDFAKGRMCAKLSIAALEAKGIIANTFEDSE